MSVNFSPFEQDKVKVKHVLYDSTVALKEGYCVCYNYDKGTATDGDDESGFVYIEKPSPTNLQYFAGWVNEQSHDAAKSGSSAAVVLINEPGPAAKVYTDQNCTAHSTYLSVAPGQWAAGADYEGVPVALANQTVDRTGTSGLVNCRTDLPAGKYRNTESPNLWTDCPLEAIKANPELGFYYFDDFLGAGAPEAGATTDAAGWSITQATSGTMGSVIGQGGEVQLSAGASTADQGINAQLLHCAVKPTAGKDIWFEARVQISHVANQYFVGVCETNTGIIDTGAIDSGETDGSMIGWFSDAGTTSGQIGTVSGKNGTAEATDDEATFAASTWYKLGFKVDGVTSVKFYIDDVLTRTVTDTNDIADGVEMALSLVCKNEDAANTNTMKVDWIKVAQLR